MADKKKKKNKSKGITIFLIIGLLIAFFLLSVGYIVFEFNRISYFNLSLKNDWRGYLAYITKNIPVVNDMIKYEYLEIGNPIANQKDIIEQRIKYMEDQNLQLEAKKEELNKLMNDISIQTEELTKQKLELEKNQQDFQKQLDEFNDYNSRINKLSAWLSSSTPQEIANALIRDEVSVQLIVDSFYTMDSGVVAEILQAIAQVNPEKAAKIIATLGEKRGE
ncbi:BREX-1 system adenine-specific DNA-methyltransferase PglX [Oceanotoga sp. DSM 15011]|jgi:flagellar motility protein MotE (MotC chaperone)|uniref:Uncharacterized protein n=1 Tax=Oceanotoga teriensis TaxID=515440 RepID=A0AA45C8Q7_9BACT|nr:MULTISPECIES: hypothetical protein [Oceanotoga]MDN5342098.1 hypothetical protein [Oceanotoga sp.]MDO7975432.1 BREX-1 system adenine-specific DNA-methyltransferase PglX [Oceanotoga teriensis]PWJ96280.1 hypothetical protein C7380_102198 [Oceanotoga teriensis]UYP00064.1 BREX-1 system adenine-specific DNA-methyltransferase PglX [Oceanotoga sp. DSM 15011]